jgi:pyruvate,water dikinase
MQPDFILSFTDVNARIENVGGKGASLARMAIAGLPVPTGFYITTDAYRYFIEKNGIQPRILDALQGLDFTNPSALEAVSRLIGGFFADAQIPEEIINAIRNSYLQLDPSRPTPVAVRSSATAEDLPEASFAGQQETYLNIRGADALLGAVKKCWASLWTARAIAYRAQHNIDPGSVALAVVVQEMVFADASGVMFTANPLNGKRDEIIISAAWGLGEAIVSGVVTPDTLTVSKPTGRLIHTEVAEKRVMTIRTESGTDEVPVPESKREKAVLTKAHATALAKLGEKIETLYGMPMDIEWTLAAGRFAIVQARPITALPEPLEWVIPVKGAVLARGSFAEFVPEPVSPLFATLAVPIAQKTTSELMGAFGMTGENNYVFAVLNDYVYVGFVFSPAMAWQMLKASFQLIGPIIRTAEQRAREAREKFVGVTEKWKARDLSTLAPSEILTGVREVFTETALYYNMAQSGTIPTAMMTEMFFGSVYKMLMKRKDDLNPEAFMFGTENHAMRADKALWDIAVWVKTQPALMKYLGGASADEINEVLQSGVHPNPEMDEFSKRFHAYLQEYGHAIYDLDFAKPTPSEDPAPLLETLKVYLAGRNDPHERQRAALELRENAKEKISKRLDPLRRKWFLNLLKSAQDTAPLREDSIADLGLGHPQIRRMLGELGKRFSAGNAISCAEDIYWLEESEVNALATLLENHEPLPSFDKKVETRKAKWRAMRQITPPNTLPKVSWLSKFYADNEQTGNIIKGFAASAGRVTARACVMLGPEDFGKMQPGDVIVAGITTPAWTPLFARASAIVTDIGGPLSHSSIVAREYGLPAVLATGVGTRRIQSGQTITVDGTKGEVILETAAEGNAHPLEWNLPNPHTVAARMSFVEFVPDAVSPLFATLAVPIASDATSKLLLEVMGWGEQGYYFDVINHYVYGCLDTRQILKYFLIGIAASPKIMRYGKTQREIAPLRSRAVAAKWYELNLTALPAADLTNGVRELFSAAAYYFTMAQSGPIPSSTMAEASFRMFYNTLVKRKSDPPAATFLLGLENLPLRAETSLFDLAQWIQRQPGLADFILRTPSPSIWAALSLWGTAHTAPLPAPLSGEFATRFAAHLDAFGYAIYDLDFTKPVPADDPTPLLDTLKVYLAGQGHDPNVRIQSQVKQRLQAEQSIVKRLDPWRRRWFQKLLKNAQEAAPERENAIAELGLTYPQIKRILRELGLRLTKGGAIACPEDIYWLEATELDELAVALDKHELLKDFSVRVNTRKVDWQQAFNVTPPAVLATNKWLSKLFTSKKAKTKNTLKGYGASAGTVTATARVLRSSEDFAHMHPGEILVAVTTTPAWTPLFAMASAIVTDIGGPLSHSSIVAREYGIPAVLATEVGTRRIHDGELITVDGSAGTVELK